MNTTMTFEQRYVQARRRFIEADFANLILVAILISETKLKFLRRRMA